MRMPSANDLRDIVNLLATDGVTVVASNIRAGISDLTGARKEQAQLTSAETSHVILFRTEDVSALPVQGYIQDTVTGTVFLVDFQTDPRKPKSGMWVEVFCHAERTAN